MKQRSKVIATSIATIAMCASLAVGGTFALFTSESEVNVAVTSGTVDVKAYADKATLSYTSLLGETLAESSATIVDNVVKIDKIVPGDTIAFELVIENYSNVTVQYQTVLSLVDGVDLFTGLQIEVDQKVYDGMTAYSNWAELNPINGENKEFDRIPVTITLPEYAGNEYQSKTAEISFIVKAVQGNAAVEQPELDENTLYVYNQNDMKLFAHSVNKGNNFSGKTVKLMSNVDLEKEAWTPIGNSVNKFQGTFDGNGNTISNLYVEGEKGLGLFGYVYSGAYIQNVTIDGAYVSGQDYLGAVVGTGYFSQNGVQNCVVKNAEIIATPYIMDNGVYDGGAKAGVVAGYVNNGNVCGNTAMDSSVSAYRDLGGIVGMMSGENYGVVAENNSVDNVTLSYVAAPNGKYDGNKCNQNMGDIVGRISNATVDKNTVGNMTYNNKWYSASDVDAALLAGGSVILGSDVTYSANNTTANSGYGATGLSVTGGAVLDGNGNTLTVTNANGTWDCAINAVNGTVKNLTVNGSFRGIFMGGASGDVYIDNVVIDEVCYTFNSDGGNKNYGVYISNSTINGWTSYSDVHKEVVFENCNFGEGTGGYKYAFCRPYNASVFKNCKFAEGFEFDTSKTSDIVFENCYYGDTLITAANAATLCKDETVFFYNGLNGITINGAKVVVASNQTSLDTALSNANGETAVVLGSGNYIIPDSAQGKNLTIVGNGDTVVATQDDGSYEGCDYSLLGATVTFENITINTDSTTYTGYAGLKATYNNCTINGAYWLYGESEFNNCTFNVSGDNYNIWTWGAGKVTFNACTFNCDGKSILVYNSSCDVYVNDCIFNDRTNGTNFTKSSLETGVDNATTTKYNIYINNTTVNGFAENDKCVGYQNVVGNKNSLTKENLNIVVDGVDVY